MINRCRNRNKLYGLILLCLFVYLWYTLNNKKNLKFKKYIPKVNYSAVLDPYLRQYDGHFKPPHERKQKFILLWTSHFYSDIWKGLNPAILDDYTHNAKCAVPECEITYDKKLIKTADVVLFHGVDFLFNNGFKNYTAKHFHALSPQRPPHQRWLFWMHETPVYYPDVENYNDLFNWTMTFSRQSNIYHPYYSYTRLSEDDEVPVYNHALRKTKKVAWMVSHCGMTREAYAMELQKYTEVTVYGECGTAFDRMGGICSKTESVCMQELQQYKFYLAFENSFCQDYVTEKYFKFGLMYGLVPIVMGAKYDALNSIPGSYIDVTDFDSIEELGNYINFLDANDYAYNAYFEWQKYFKVTDGLDKMCLICQHIHNLDATQAVSRYTAFNVFWSEYNLCKPFDKVKGLLDRQIEDSKKNGKS